MFYVLYRKHNHGLMSRGNYQSLFVNDPTNFRKNAAVTHLTLEMLSTKFTLELKEKCDREGKVNQEKVIFLDPGKTSVRFSF